MARPTPTPGAGTVFGRLTVTGEPVRIGNNLCLPVCCTCGNEKTVLKSNLVSGATSSCGCLNAELTGIRSRKHPVGSKKTYDIWHAMLSRCNNPENAHYHNYGGRGIRVCKRWHQFQNFWEDMGPAPAGLTLERVKNHKGYSKGNCEWVTRQVNLMNKRTTVRVVFRGVEMNLKQLSTLCGVPWRNLYHRLYVQNWSIEDAIKPVRFKSPSGQTVWRGNKP